MKGQTLAAATGMVNADQEWLSENPNQGHRAPRDRTVTLLKWGSMCRPGGPLSMPFSALAHRRVLAP
jgi:hypothetical protein